MAKTSGFFMAEMFEFFYTLSWQHDKAAYLSINPLYGVRGSFTQGELEGAKPASNQIKCRAKPCLARRAWSEATIFVPQGGTKITTLFQAVEKSRRLFRQPEKSAPPGALLFPVRQNYTKSPTCPPGFLFETQKGEKGVDNGTQRAYYATIPTGKTTVKEES